MVFPGVNMCISICDFLPALPRVSKAEAGGFLPRILVQGVWRFKKLGTFAAQHAYFMGGAVAALCRAS